MDITLSSCSHSSPKPAAIVVHLKRSLVPPKWKDSVRVVGTSEYREAALTLAHAFAADDYAKYLVDPGLSTAEEKWRLHVDIMTYAVAAHCINGLVTTIGPDYDSVALWLPPGKHLDGWWTLLRSGLWRLNFQLSAEGRRRYFDEILPLLHDTKAAVLGARDADAWYLVYLGTKPNSQGRGYARLLLEDVMERADTEHRPIYLESSALANNAYYQKFGFQVQRDIFLERGQDPVRLSIMVREPRRGGEIYPTSTSSRSTGGGGSDTGSGTTIPSSPVSLTSSAPSLALSGASSTSSLPSLGGSDGDDGDEEEEGKGKFGVSGGGLDLEGE